MKITYKFYLRDPDTSGTKLPIYMQITADRKSTKRAIGFDLYIKEWDSVKGRAKNNLTVNSKINLLETKLNNLQFDLQKTPHLFQIEQATNSWKHIILSPWNFKLILMLVLMFLKI